MDRYTPLEMQINRLSANRDKITGWEGDEAMLDEIITSLRAQVTWLREPAAKSSLPAFANTPFGLEY
jgi:hypothetical protein